jgi:hypothetical protein
MMTQCPPSMRCNPLYPDDKFYCDCFWHFLFLSTQLLVSSCSACKFIFINLSTPFHESNLDQINLDFPKKCLAARERRQLGALKYGIRPARLPTAEGGNTATEPPKSNEKNLYSLYFFRFKIAASASILTTVCFLGQKQQCILFQF